MEPLRVFESFIKKLIEFNNRKRELTFAEFEKTIHNKVTVFITNPRTVIKAGKTTLKVNGEEIPFKKLNGVIFILDVEDIAQKLLIQKVPTVVFTKKSVGYSNLNTVAVDGERLKELLKIYCRYIGEELQRFFSRYLRNRGAGTTVLVRGKRRNYYIRRNRFFLPRYADCSEPARIISEIQSYINEVVFSPAIKALLGFMMITSNRLGIPIPEIISLGTLAIYYSIAVYSFYYLDYIKAKTYGYEVISRIPPRGQIFVLINWIVSNEHFKNFLFDNLFYLKRFLVG